MARQKTDKQKLRMIHVRITDDLHKRLRIKAAELDTTIQDWVGELIARELEKKGK